VEKKMKFSRAIILTVAALLVSAGIVTTGYNRREIAAGAARRHEALNSQTQWRAQIARLKKEISTTARPHPREEKKTIPAPVVPAAAVSPGDLLAQNPALAALRLNWFAAQARLDFGPCFQTLGLSPSQISAVCERMARYQHEVDELGRTHPRAREPGSISPSGESTPNPEAAEFVRQYGEATRQYEFELASLLGTDGFKAFSNYTSAEQLWFQAGSLAGALYATETPLSPVQSQQLVETMKKYAQSPSGRFSVNTVDASALLNETAAFLSPAQLSILARQLESTRLWNSH
jgi:hypothetical protein